MQRLTKLSRPTITRGIRELNAGKRLRVDGRVRRPGGGRPVIEAQNPGLTAEIEDIMRESTAGQPQSHLKWTVKSTDRIAEEITRRGIAVSANTVRRRLKVLDFSLQGHVKDKEGRQSPDRDAQFRYINSQVTGFARRGQPVISVDGKKKERVGAFKTAGRRWRPKGQPSRVNVYDFPDLAEGTAIPYGTYDVGGNEGFVNVGMTHDTAEFAVASIRRWWYSMGVQRYPNAREILICADGGGSNSSRVRSWKYFVQTLADATGLHITVCHYPPGTSKWNKIEHRMFAFISKTWAGERLETFETVVQLIASTRTKTGLKVRARLDKRDYETGVAIDDDTFAEINLRRHDWHPNWNYTVSPR